MISLICDSPFFYATERKGTTIHDKTKRKSRDELTAKIRDSEKKIRKYENREKLLRQKLSREERRERKHPHRVGSVGVLTT